MKTVNALDGTMGLIGNLCFDDNVNNLRANKAALITILRDDRYVGILRGYTYGFDKDTGDVLYFFPWEFLNSVKKEIRKEFLETIKKAWIDAKFEILDEREIDGDVYFDVGFKSYFFRLRSII